MKVDLNFFIKLLVEDYQLNTMQVQTLTHRLLADERELDSAWGMYNKYGRKNKSGVDRFKPLLTDLLT